MIKYWLEEGWYLLRFYRLRLLLSLGSIAIGIGAVCALCAINLVVAKNSEEILTKYGQARFIATLMPLTAQQKKQSEQHLGINDIAAFCQLFKPALTLLPYQVMRDQEDKTIIGTLSGLDSHLEWPLRAGRTLHPLDEQSKVAVVGQALQNKVGQTLSLYGQYFEIVGVLEEIPANPLIEFNPNRAIFISLSTLARLKPLSGVNSFIVQSEHLPLLVAEQMFKDKIKILLGIEQVMLRDATLFAQVLIKQVSMTIQMLKLLALTTLLLGMLSMVNLLIILIDERKKEIGLRLALGATAMTIGWQFLREILILCALGAIGGIVFGHLAAYIIVMKLGLTYYFGWFSWLVGLPVSAMMGILAGIIPIFFATRLHPVKLLNS